MVLDSKRFLTQELANVTQMIEEHFRIALSSNRIVANAITELLENKALREKMGHKGKYVAPNYSVERMIDKLNNLYLSLSNYT